MKISLISSLQDPGGTTISCQLKELLNEPRNFTYPLENHELDLLEVKDRLIWQDHIDENLDADLLIFLSRHTSENPVPVLTVHVTGNITTADFGGLPRSLAVASPAWMHAILRKMSGNAPAGYRVSYEITHHGPSEVSVPSLFVEVGSTEKEWNDPVAGRAVAKSVLEASPVDVIPLVGFGGTHYARRQTEIALNSRGAFGHIAHSRDISSLDRTMVRLMTEKSGAVAAFIDRKAIRSGDIRTMEDFLSSCGLIRLTESDLMSFGDLSWKTYLAIRGLAAAVNPECRLHLHNPGEGTPALLHISPQLIEMAVKADEREFFDSLSGMSLVRLSMPKKSILPVFIIMEENRPVILNALIRLCVTLIRREEDIAIEGDHLIIRKIRFDPGNARELGVPKGPLYGELMNGRTITIGERVITPEMVQVSSVKKIHIPGLERYT